MLFILTLLFPSLVNMTQHSLKIASRETPRPKLQTADVERKKAHLKNPSGTSAAFTAPWIHQYTTQPEYWSLTVVSWFRPQTLKCTKLSQQMIDDQRIQQTDSLPLHALRRWGWDGGNRLTTPSHCRLCEVNDLYFNAWNMHKHKYSSLRVLNLPEKPNRSHLSLYISRPRCIIGSDFSGFVNPLFHWTSQQPRFWTL